HGRAGEPPGDVATGEEEFRGARAGPGLIVQDNGDVEQEVLGDEQPIGERKSHGRAGLAERELTGPTGLSQLACDWRIAMATTQRSAPITLTLTDQAAVEVRKFMAEEKVSPETAGLRIGVLPGGCSGFKYSLSIED